MKFTLLLIALCWLCPVSIAAQTSPDDQINQFLKSYCQTQAESSLAQVAQQYWILDAQTIFWHSLDDGTTLVYTADVMQQRQEMPAKKGSCSPANVKLVVQGVVASVSFNEKTTFADGTSLERLGLGCVEQVAGGWKWHVLTYHTVDQHK
jgi:hypothetical protein